jgi:hypothetical protein
MSHTVEDIAPEFGKRPQPFSYFFLRTLSVLRVDPQALVRTWGAGRDGLKLYLSWNDATTGSRHTRESACTLWMVPIRTVSGKHSGQSLCQNSTALSFKTSIDLEFPVKHLIIGYAVGSLKVGVLTFAHTKACFQVVQLQSAYPSSDGNLLKGQLILSVRRPPGKLETHEYIYQ